MVQNAMLLKYHITAASDSSTGDSRIIWAPEGLCLDNIHSFDLSTGFKEVAPPSTPTLRLCEAFSFTFTNAV